MLKRLWHNVWGHNWSSNGQHHNGSWITMICTCGDVQDKYVP